MGAPGRKVGLKAYLLLVGLFLLPAAVFMVPGPKAAAQGGPVVPSTQQLDLGQQVFQARCATCHGANAAGTFQAPSLLGLGPAWYDFMMSTGRMPATAPQPVQALPRPPVLSPPEIAAVTAYLTSLTPEQPGIAIPVVRPGQGNISEGQEIFTVNCSPCHGATGNGGVAGTASAPSLHIATATQVGEAIRIGPGTMPKFGPVIITPDQLNSLARYVLYLANPNSPGGSNLDFGGPVVEGFVALFIGLGAVLLVSRYIGARS